MRSGRLSTDSAKAALFRPESRVWGKPEIVSTMNPAAFGTGEPFNMIKAAGYLPRPGISGAAWETTLKGPQRELDDPAFHEGVSVFGTHELIEPPTARGRTPPGFVGGGYGGGGPKVDGVHYRIARVGACGISGKLLRKYSPDRPPTPIKRLQELEAKRRAQALANGRGPDILLVDGEPPTRPATRGSRRAAEETSQFPGDVDLHRVRIAYGSGLDDISMGDMSIDLGSGHAAAKDKEHQHRRTEVVPVEEEEVDYAKIPVKDRLQRFSRALTKRFTKAVDAFAFIDDDGSGALSIDELAEGLTGVGISIEAPILKEMMNVAGLATRSTIVYKDFLKLFLGQFKPMTKEEQEAKALAAAQELLIRKLSGEHGEIDHDALLRAFQTFDDNGDGWIDDKELRQGFLAFGLGDLDDPESPMAPFKRLVDSCDDNDDGKINYKEFLELAGFKKGRGDFNNRDVKGGGALQGFREINKFDAKILERERRKKQAQGLSDLEPDTPKGLTRWRAKYAKSFFGSKYITDMERAAEKLVADKVEGRYVEPVAPWSIATRRYMEHVLKVPPEGDNLTLFKGIQTSLEEQNETAWTSTAHKTMSDPYNHRIDRLDKSKPVGPAPPLPRVDGYRQNTGTSIPGFMPGVHRQIGAFRKSCLLSADWDNFKDRAIRSSIRLTHTEADARPRYLRNPAYETVLRGKTVKDVVRDYNHENNVDFSQTRTLVGPVDVNNVFSKYGGQWTLHDSVRDIIHKSSGESVAPPVDTGLTKPMVEYPELTDAQKEQLRLRGGDPEPRSGRATTEMDANSFMSQPMQRDLFCRTVLNSGKRTPGPSRRKDA